MIPMSMSKQSGHKTIYYYLVIKRWCTPGRLCFGSMLVLSLLALAGESFRSINCFFTIVVSLPYYLWASSGVQNFSAKDFKTGNEIIVNHKLTRCCCNSYRVSGLASAATDPRYKYIACDAIQQQTCQAAFNDALGIDRNCSPFFSQTLV